MQNKFYNGIKSLILLLIIYFAISCMPIKKLRYLNDIDELKEPIINPRGDKLIMPFDKLDIKVFSIDEKTNQLFNSNAKQEVGTTSSGGGYLVDEVGNINYIFTGKINVKGMTPEQAGIKLGKALSEYVSNATVSVKFIDSNITLLGEVVSPGMRSFSQYKLNIYEALALGGGISQYGDRKSVILIRQEGDRIMHHKLNLSDSKIAGKVYYYIQSNDVIVVEPMRSSSWYRYNSTSMSTILTTITSFLAIYIILKK